MAALSFDASHFQPIIAADDYADLPDSMRDAKRWLLWKAIPQGEGRKPRKVPFYASGTPRRGVLDSPDDMSRLASLDAALAALQSGEYKGLGFALGPDGTGNHWQGIDLDQVAGRPLLQTLVDDLPGYTEASPSGDGWHAIGYGRAFDSLGSNASGIEAYSSGRFFTVTADSAGRHDPVCLAGFVEKRLKPLHSPASAAPAPATIEQVVDAIQQAAIPHLRSALLAMRADDRDLWQRIGHALKTGGEIGRGLWLEWSSTSDKYDAADAARTWDSFKPTKTHWKNVFSEAQRQGWTNPASNAGQLVTLAAYRPVTDGPRFPLLTADELANLPPLRWRIKGVLPESGLAAVYGPSGGGKSFLVLDMLASVADGCEWFEHRVNRAPVVYLALEGEAGLSQRVQAYRLQHGEHACKGMHFMTVPFSLLANGDVQDLAESIAAAGAAGGVVCIDTLNRAAPGADENSSQDMGLIIEAAKALQMALGGLVLLVHHTGKDAGKGLRGHSSLFAALDAAIEVSRDGDSRAWAVAKSKDGQDGNAHPFRLEVVELGEDGDGEPITSCVIAPEEAPAGGKRGCKLPQSAKVALDALKLAQEQHGTPPPATVRDRWGMQAPGVVVTEEQWRDVAYKSGISGSDAPDAKRMAFNRAFQTLQQKEQIRVWDGYVWSLW